MIVLLADESLGFQVLHERREKQRIAPRQSFQRAGELRREGVTRTPLRQICGHRIGAEPLERDRRRPPMCDQARP